MPGRPHCLAAMLLCTLGACQPAAEPAAPSAPTAAQQAAPDDAALAAAVRRRLVNSPTLNLQVDVAAGHVRLRGAVPDTEARREAAAQTADVPGVRAVDNQLSVQLAPVPATASAPPDSTVPAPVR